jgi:hypothetical protein
LHFADRSAVHRWNLLMFRGEVIDLAVRLRLEIYIYEQDTCAITADLKLANEPQGDDAAPPPPGRTHAAGEIEK